MMKNPSQAPRSTDAEQGNAIPRLGVASRDFDELGQALAGVQVEVRQLGAGPFYGEVEQVAVGPFLILRTAVNRVVQARGAVRKNVYLLSLLTPHNEGATWRGTHHRAGDVNLNHPSSEIDHLTTASYTNLSIALDIPRLRLAGRRLLGVEVEECLRGVQAWRAPPAAFAQLQAVLGLILGQARSATSALPPPNHHSGLEDALTRRLLAVMVGESIPTDPSNANRVARNAEEYMLANLDQPLRMAEVCRQFDVSERTLRYAFQQRYGVSPLAYFKRQKLNAIRACIKSGSAEAARVQEIARRWGVVHFGNFAADYRRLFGELPSQTRKGSPLVAGPLS